MSGRLCWQDEESGLSHRPCEVIAHFGGERPEPAQWVEGRESGSFVHEPISSMRVAEGAGERRAQMALGLESGRGLTAFQAKSQQRWRGEEDDFKLALLIRVVKRHGELLFDWRGKGEKDQVTQQEGEG